MSWTAPRLWHSEQHFIGVPFDSIFYICRADAKAGAVHLFYLLYLDYIALLDVHQFQRVRREALAEDGDTVVSDDGGDGFVRRIVQMEADMSFGGEVLR